MTTIDESDTSFQQNSEIVFNKVKVSFSTVGDEVRLSVFDKNKNKIIKKIVLKNTPNLFFNTCKVSSTERYLVCIFYKVTGESIKECVCRIFDLEQIVVPKFYILNNKQYINNISENGEYIMGNYNEYIWKNTKDSLQLIDKKYSSKSTFRYPYKTYSNCCTTYEIQNQLLDLSSSNAFSILNQTDSKRIIKISESSDYLAINYFDQNKSILYDFKGNKIASSTNNDQYNNYFSEEGSYFFTRNTKYFKVWNILNKNIDSVSLDKLNILNVDLTETNDITINDSLITFNPYKGYSHYRNFGLYNYKNNYILLKNYRQISVKEKYIYLIDSIGCFKIFNLKNKSFTQTICKNFWGFELIDHDKIILKIFNGTDNGINTYTYKLYFFNIGILNEANFLNKLPEITNVIFSNDYSLVATFHSDGLTYVWKLSEKTYKLILTPIRDGKRVFFSKKKTNLLL